MKRRTSLPGGHARAPASAHKLARGKTSSDAVQPLLQMQGAIGNRETSALLEGLRSGEPLDRRARLLMEAAYGRRFDAVRVHAHARADEAAKDLRANAFTFGSNIYFRAGRYSPRTPSGLRLLGHELAHVVQQGGPRSVRTPDSRVPLEVRNSPHLEREADAAADAAAAGRAISPAALSSTPAGPAVQCSAESDLIGSETSYGNLNEEALAKALLERALRSEHDFVQRVLSELGTTDRDDVSNEFVKAATDNDLAALRASESGRRLLSRLYDEITSGKPDAEELEQAERVLKEKAQAVQWADVEKGIAKAKIFPFRLPGLTVLNAAPMSAQRRPKGRVWVKMPVHVKAKAVFRKETDTLPTEVFTSGLELPEDEIVGVKMYDLGGEIHYRPALYLVQLANESTTTTLEKIGETAAIGLSLGTMGGAAAGGSRLAQVLLWADRIALGVGTITSILREHRGWIISKFGDSGREFLHYVDIVNSIAAFYGGARALVGMGQLLVGLAKSAGRWRSSIAAAKDLSETERAVVDAATKYVDDVQNDVTQLQKLNTRNAVPEQAPVPAAPPQTKAAPVPEAPLTTKATPVTPKTTTPPKSKLAAKPRTDRTPLEEDPELRRQVEILEEFGEAESMVPRSKLEEEFAVGPAGESTARRSPSPPGSRGESVPKQVGKFVHKNPDLVREAFRDFMKDQKEEAAKFFKDFHIDWPEGLPPNEGPNRIVISLPGKDYIPDGIDWQGGIIYELKTIRGKAGGETQAKTYALWMNREFPLPNGQSWQHKVVTYNEEALTAFLKLIGWLE